MSTKKLVLNEIRGTVSSGQFNKRLGYRVLKIHNTTSERIGQAMTKQEVDDAIQHGRYVVDIIGAEHADKLEDKD